MKNNTITLIYSYPSTSMYLVSLVPFFITLTLGCFRSLVAQDGGNNSGLTLYFFKGSNQILWQIETNHCGIGSVML